MSRKGTGEPVRNQADKGGSGAARAARLKAALKANLGRRKAQARSRAGADAAPEPDGRAGQVAGTGTAEPGPTDDRAEPGDT